MNMIVTCALQRKLYNNSKLFTILNQLNSNQLKSNQMLVFEERKKNRVPGEKPLRAEWRTNKLSPLMTPSPGI